MEVLEDTWSDLELARLPAYRCYHHSQGEYENGDVLNLAMLEKFLALVAPRRLHLGQLSEATMLALFNPID